MCRMRSRLRAICPVDLATVAMDFEIGRLTVMSALQYIPLTDGRKMSYIRKRLLFVEKLHLRILVGISTSLGIGKLIARFI